MIMTKSAEETPNGTTSNIQARLATTISASAFCPGKVSPAGVGRFANTKYSKTQPIPIRALREFDLLRLLSF
jgi:hypothetical protein